MVIHDRPEDLKAQQEKRLELDAILYLVDDVETLFICIWFSRPIHYYYHLLIVCFFQLLDFSIRACKTVHPSFLLLFCSWKQDLLQILLPQPLQLITSPLHFLGVSYVVATRKMARLELRSVSCACLEFVANIIQNCFFRRYSLS